MRSYRSPAMVVELVVWQWQLEGLKSLSGWLADRLTDYCFVGFIFNRCRNPPALGRFNTHLVFPLDWDLRDSEMRLVGRVSAFSSLTWIAVA